MSTQLSTHTDTHTHTHSKTDKESEIHTHIEYRQHVSAFMSVELATLKTHGLHHHPNHPTSAAAAAAAAMCQCLNVASLLHTVQTQLDTSQMSH